MHIKHDLLEELCSFPLDSDAPLPHYQTVWSQCLPNLVCFSQTSVISTRQGETFDIIDVIFDHQKIRFFFKELSKLADIFHSFTEKEEFRHKLCWWVKCQSWAHKWHTSIHLFIHLVCGSWRAEAYHQQSPRESGGNTLNRLQTYHWAAHKHESWFWRG